MSSVAKKLAFASLPLLLLLAVGELGVRLMWEPPYKLDENRGNTMMPHPTRIWSLPVGAQSAYKESFTITEQGIRQSAVAAQGVTIVTTGDSSIFGHGLPDGDTLHDQLQASLRGRGIVTNAHTIAIPGYSSEQTRVMLEEVGWDLHPDLLVIGNLWSDNDIRYFTDRVWMAQLGQPAPLADRIEHASSLLTFLRWRVAPPQQEKLPVGWVRDPYATGRRRVSLPEYAENLDLMVMGAAEHGASVIFLSPCNEVLIDPTRAEETFWAPYFQTMERVAAYRGVPLVSACTALQEVGLTKAEAFLDSMHPTALGNAVYTQALVGALLRAGWPFKAIPINTDLPPFDDPAPENWDVEAMEFLGQTAP